MPIVSAQVAWFGAEGWGSRAVCVGTILAKLVLVPFGEFLAEEFWDEGVAMRFIANRLLTVIFSTGVLALIASSVP